MAKMLKKTSKVSMLRKKIAKEKSLVKSTKSRYNKDRDRLLSTAVVSSVKKAFGSKPLTKRLNPAALARQAWDATNPFHLALPITTGPYQVVRLTRAWTTESGTTVTLLGPMVSDGVVGGRGQSWTNVVAVENSGLISSLMNSANGTRIWTMPMTSMNAATTLTPSAFTVTIMNGNALQTTSGICYAGRMSMAPTLADSIRSWQTFRDNFISYHAPRVLSASKLAMNAVRVSCLPSDVPAISNFSSNLDLADSTITWNGTGGGEIEHGGFAPIVFVKPSGLILNMQVTVEYRMRFDPDSVAASTHVHHKAVPDTFWNDAMAAAIATGHGVYDVAEAGIDVADAILHI